MISFQALVFISTVPSLTFECLSSPPHVVVSLAGTDSSFFFHFCLPVFLPLYKFFERSLNAIWATKKERRKKKKWIQTEKQKLNSKTYHAYRMNKVTFSKSWFQFLLFFLFLFFILYKYTPKTKLLKETGRLKKQRRANNRVKKKKK